LNETAIKKLGWENPIGKWLSKSDGLEGTVIGVVKDFHYNSMRVAIDPMVLTLSRDELNYLSVRIRAGDISQILQFLEQSWKEFAPRYPFEYFFIDKEFESYYRFEQRLGVLFRYSSVLAIVISCLGVFGLVSFSAEKRRKEIGIRKTLGASIPAIVALLSKEYLKLVIIANILGLPVAYFFMNRWLQQFPYRIIPSWVTFLTACIMTLVIALLTVSYQTVKAAVANPVKALKNE